MAHKEITALPGDADGFELVAVDRNAATEAYSSHEIVLRLRSVHGAPKRCSRCGEIVDIVHEVSGRRVRDLPIMEAETWLVFPRDRRSVHAAEGP